MKIIKYKYLLIVLIAHVNFGCTELASESFNDIAEQFEPMIEMYLQLLCVPITCINAEFDGIGVIRKLPPTVVIPARPMDG